MKKVFAILLPLMLIISTASCSQNSSSSKSLSAENVTKTQITDFSESETEPENESSAAETESETNPVTEAKQDKEDPAEGTNYTKGTFEDGVYTNEFSDIRINIPDEMERVPDSDLQKQKQQSIAALTEESDIIRESAVIWDSWFANNNDCMYIRFINTKKAFPDVEEITVEKMLDDNREWTDKFTADAGIVPEWKEREIISLGGEEYTRDAYTIGSDYCYLYMRRIDDDFICSISINGKSIDKTTDYYESLFE